MNLVVTFIGGVSLFACKRNEAGMRAMTQKVADTSQVISAERCPVLKTGGKVTAYCYGFRLERYTRLSVRVSTCRNLLL